MPAAGNPEPPTVLNGNHLGARIPSPAARAREDGPAGLGRDPPPPPYAGARFGARLRSRNAVMASTGGTGWRVELPTSSGWV